MNSIIIDFNDSFTYNVATYLYLKGLEVEVLNYKKDLTSIDKFIKRKKKCLVIIGPGPGSAHNYCQFIPRIRTIIKNPNIKVMGICLGHQLIWYSFGYKIIDAKIPRHGQTTEIILPHWDEFDKSFWSRKFTVQLYNSLEVEFPRDDKNVYVKDSSFLIGRFRGGISYQFHPESIATCSPSVFFDTFIF